MKQGFPLPLIVTPINANQWRLVEPFVYITKEGEEIEIPKNFVTDFASIPRIPLVWTIIGPPATGLYKEAAIPHDFIYATQTMSRKKIDKIFLEAMAFLKVPWWKRRIMFYAVRAFSWIPWNNHKKRLQVPT